MFSIYILQSKKNKRTYVGFCKNVSNRLHEHNLGKVDATRNHRPFRVLFVEQEKDLKEAKKREKYWKSGAGRRKLKRFFKEGFPLIQKF